MRRKAGYRVLAAPAGREGKAAGAGRARFMAASCAASLLFLAGLCGCQEEADRPEGLVRITISNAEELAAGSASRLAYAHSEGPSYTAIPEGSAALFDYEYWFRPEGGGTPVSPMRPSGEGDTFALSPGVYTVRVKAFVKGSGASTAAYDEVDSDNEVASGDSAPFTVIADALQDNVSVQLTLVSVTDAQGSVAYSITRPEGTRITSITFTSMTRGTTADYTGDPDTSTTPLTRSATKDAIPAGFYTFIVQLEDSEGRTAGAVEVVHVYHALLTTLEYTFTWDDFAAGIPRSVEGTVRVSLALWDTEDELEALVSAPYIFKNNPEDTLTALAPAASSGFTFERWELNGVEVTHLMLGVVYDRQTHTFTATASLAVGEYLLTLFARKDGALYSKWAKFRVRETGLTVTFETSGGSAVASQTVEAGYTASRPVPDPTRAGSTFVDWYKDPAFTTLWNFEYDLVRADTTLYAAWTAKTYTVSFDPNGGDEVDYTQKTVTFAQPYGALPAANWPPSIFIGWYTASTGGEPVTETTLVLNPESHTLYAHWTIRVIVTFVTNGGLPVPPAQAVVKGTLVTPPDEPERAGYTFDRWYQDVDLTTPWDFEKDTVDEEPITLYAGWTGNPFTVTFDQRPGTGGTESVTAISGSTMPAITLPSRTGYFFEGYFTETAGGGTQYYSGDGESLRNWDIAEDTTLYALWRARPYTVTYYANLGSGSGPEPETVLYDSDYTVEGKGGFKRTGYNFAGWNTAADGSGTSYQPGDTLTVNGDIGLYACWIGITLTVTFDSNGGGTPTYTSKTVNYDAEYGYLPSVGRAGYNFLGWFTEREEGSEVYSWTWVTIPQNHTLYAHWGEK